MNTLKTLNVGLRFALELCLLAALAFWGWRAGSSGAGRWLLAAGAPLVAAVVWGTFLSPRATVTLPRAWKTALQVVVLGTGALALAAAGRPALAWVLGATILLNAALLLVWNS